MSTMNILAIDTSGPSAGVAMLRGEQLAFEATVQNKLTHSVNLMPMVQEALQHSDMTMQDVSLFACVVGPGSFTGVRIGVAAVKGMAMATGKPCVAVNALEALAVGAHVPGQLICPIRDARVQQVYGAAFRDGQRLMEDAALKLPLYLDRIKELGQEFLFVGDGVEAYRPLLLERLGEQAKFLPPHLNVLKAGAAAALGQRDQHTATDGQGLLPLYLRQPQAERERTAREHG